MELVNLYHSIYLIGFPLPILRLLLHHLLNTLRQQSLKSGSPILFLGEKCPMAC